MNGYGGGVVEVVDDELEKLIEIVLMMMEMKLLQ